MPVPVSAVRFVVVLKDETDVRPLRPLSEMLCQRQYFESCDDENAPTATLLGRALRLQHPCTEGCELMLTSPTAL